jgi:hypothetical protein
MCSSLSTNEWSAAIHIVVPVNNELPDSQQLFCTFHFAWQLIHAKRSMCHSNVKPKTAEVICGTGTHGFAERRMKAMEFRMIAVK